ncbi:MAG: (d)CMP kinase [Candidatus Dasytiphilus stammeri]
MNLKVPVITIDGPGGVGKGTIGYLLSKKLQWHYLNSGVIYRVLAFSALHHKISVTAENKLVSIAMNLDLHLSMEKDVSEIIFENINISNMIYMESVGEFASQIAILPKVRKALLYKLRALRSLPGLIAEGRDMGTIVFPDAMVKFFLDASVEERSRRRMLQLQKKGFNVKFEELLSQLKKRDERDSNRKTASLKPAEDALIIDSTKLRTEQVFEKVLKHVLLQIDVHKELYSD